MNRAILIGNLTKDPELRFTGSGIPVCTFTLAINRRFQNQQGQREADFIPIVVWRAQGESCAKYLRKGSKAAVCGTIQTRTYDGQDGTRRYVTEVIADEVQFLNTRAGGEEGPGGIPQEQYAPPPATAAGNTVPPPGLQSVELDDDELPF